MPRCYWGWLEWCWILDRSNIQLPSRTIVAISCKSVSLIVRMLSPVWLTPPPPPANQKHGTYNLQSSVYTSALRNHRLAQKYGPVSGEFGHIPPPPNLIFISILSRILSLQTEQMPIVLDVDSLAMVWNVSQQPSIESQHPARRLDTRRGGEMVRWWWDQRRMGRKLRNNFPSGRPKKMSRGPVDHTKKWVELWLAAVSPCRAPIGRLSPLHCLITSPSCWGTHFLYLSNPPSVSFLPILLCLAA